MCNGDYYTEPHREAVTGYARGRSLLSERSEHGRCDCSNYSMHNNVNISVYVLVSDEPNEIVIEAALTLQNETRCCVTHCLVHDTSGEALRPKHVIAYSATYRIYDRRAYILLSSPKVL